jgi:hypothetical protein
MRRTWLFAVTLFLFCVSAASAQHGGAGAGRAGAAGVKAGGTTHTGVPAGGASRTGVAGKPGRVNRMDTTMGGGASHPKHR